MEEDVIVTGFKCYDGQSTFRFEDGHVQAQSDHKYSYHYSYRPNALIVEVSTDWRGDRRPNFDYPTCFV